MSAKSTRPYFCTTVGKKFIMGISGLIWAGFVLGHMVGNMLMFISPEAYNAYGHALTSGKLIYLVEAVLIFALLTHIGLAINLTLENRRARGSQRYAATSKSEKATTIESRTMAAQGSLILAFVITHIITFKYGTYYETTVDGVVMRDLYKLIVEVFHLPQYTAWYIVALFVLGFHLKHGFGSVFQSLGLKNERTAPIINKLSITYAALVAGGFISQPLFVILIAGK